MPGGMFKMNPKVDDVVNMCGCTGPDNVKLVVMGTIDSGGSGCMCPANAFVKALIRHVIVREKDLVIMDMEAGIEHLGRATARGVDAMIAVVEPGMRSIETVERIMHLGKEIGITRYFAVINKADDPGPSGREAGADGHTGPRHHPLRQMPGSGRSGGKDAHRCRLPGSGVHQSDKDQTGRDVRRKKAISRA